MCTSRLLFLLVVLLSTFHLKADVFDKTLTLTITRPTIVADTVLPPGTHIWKLLDSSSNRHIVQITNQDTGAVEATILALPNYRRFVSDRDEVDYWGTPEGSPNAIHAWFCPGDNSGQEFAYPSKLLATLTAHSRPRLEAAKARPEVTALAVPQPRRPALVAQKRVRSAPSEGSWAVITGGIASPSEKTSESKTHPGFWDRVSRLPLTATIVPLVAIVGFASLAMYLMLRKFQNVR